MPLQSHGAKSVLDLRVRARALETEHVVVQRVRHSVDLRRFCDSQAWSCGGYTEKGEKFKYQGVVLIEKVSMHGVIRHSQSNKSTLIDTPHQKIHTTYPQTHSHAQFELPPILEKTAVLVRSLRWFWSVPPVEIMAGGGWKIRACCRSAPLGDVSKRDLYCNCVNTFLQPALASQDPTRSRQTGQDNDMVPCEST